MKTIKPKTCKCCGKEFIPYTSLIKYCSFKCENKMAIRKEKEKKAKIRTKKKESVSYLTKVADTLWSEYIRKKAGKCEYCGSIEHLNAHHIYTRHSRATRWEVSNGISLCRKHHTFSDEFSAHKTPVEFVYWLEKYKGKEFMQKLQLKANTVRQIDSFDLVCIIEDLKHLINNLGI